MSQLYRPRKTTRIGPSMTDKQRRASVRNYGLFQIAGSLGNLPAVRGQLRTQLKNSAVVSDYAYFALSKAIDHLGYAITALQSAQEELRRANQMFAAETAAIVSAKATPQSELDP